MTFITFAGGVLAGAILVGAAWWGRVIAQYGPADEQDLDRYQQEENHQ